MIKKAEVKQCSKELGKFILFLLIVHFSLPPPFQDVKSAEIYYLPLKLFKICSYDKNVASLSTFSSTMIL